MASQEGSDHLKAPETIPGEVQNKILALCGTAGMQPGQLLILHNVLRNFDNPDIKERVGDLGEHSSAPQDFRAKIQEHLRNL